MRVAALYRYAVKGLSGDALTEVSLTHPGETFPDDRRFALMRRNKDDNRPSSDWQEGKWMHKENFLCAFSEPELLSRLDTSYSTVSGDPTISRAYPWDAHDLAALQDDERLDTRRILTIRDRMSGHELVTPPLDLNLSDDRQRLADFLSDYSSSDVVCLTAGAKQSQPSSTTSTTTSSTSLPSLHTHQFGNTSSGYKRRNDTRTVHIINQKTVDALSERLQLPLNARRFRPNIVLDTTDDESLSAWSEFDWIGKRLVVQRKNTESKDASQVLSMTVISKTVRCKGVSVDPFDLDRPPLDISALLVQHFPEHGPYLGVYAVIDSPGQVAVGDQLTVLN